MKILITGASGFLGRYLVDLFSSEKNKLTTVVRRTSDTSYLEEKGVRLVYGDLHDEKCVVTAAKQADVIIHAAATLRGSWDDFHAVNVEATRRLLDAAVANKVKRFVFISSVIVYDHSKSVPGTCFSEEMKYESENQTYYCKTKIEAEKYVNQYHAEMGLPATILRPAAIYGKMGPLFLSRLGFSAGQRRYLIIGNGQLSLPLSHVRGIAEAVKLSIRKRIAVGKTYNVVETGAVTQKEFFDQLRKQVDPKFSTIRVPYPLMKFMSAVADKMLGIIGMRSPLPLAYLKLCATPFFYSNEKIREELGWKPQSDVPQSLSDVMLWHKEGRLSKRKLENDDFRVPISSEQKLRAGIVGCGVISGPHLGALKRLKNVAVVAVSDPAEEARQAVSKKYNVLHAYKDYKEMLQKEELDVVHVCTPGQSHAEISIEAMKHGCHVFVEKPFASTGDEARKILSAAKRHKTRLCVGHNHIFDKVMIKARNIIASGTLGRLSHVESWYGTSYSSDTKSRYISYEGRNNWAYDFPGSLYQNFISHPISLLLDVMDEASVRDVQAKFHRVVPHMPSDELQVTFENKRMTGLLKMSMAVSPRYMFLNVYGTQGTLRVDFLNKTVFVDNAGGGLPRVIGRSLSSLTYAKVLFGASFRNIFSGILGKYNMYQGNETLIRLFYKSILENQPSPIDANEGLRSMEIMDDIWLKLQADSVVESQTQVKASNINGRGAGKPKAAQKGNNRKKKARTVKGNAPS